MIYKVINTESTKNIFENWQETLVWSCQQQVMGAIYADSQEAPESAMALLGDFCFLSGKPNQELALFKPEDCQKNFIIIVPENEAWGEVIEAGFGDRAKKVSRYGIKKGGENFEQGKLEDAMAAIDPVYSLKLIDEEVYNYCRENDWCRDFVAQYPDYSAYERLGLGVVVMKDGVPVAGASSYSSYQNGIEIEIVTREEYRRQGLAYACGAKLILECLKRDLYPSWDAHNPWSVKLAEKLGYHYDHEYTAYEITDY